MFDEALKAAVEMWYIRAEENISDSPEGHCRALLVAALPILERWYQEEINELKEEIEALNG